MQTVEKGTKEATMASKEAEDSSSSEDDDDPLTGVLALWQKAWLERHRDELIRRVPTIDVVDQLVQRGAIDTGMDAYQRILACHQELRNDRARLLLDYVTSHTQKIFWDFQEALSVQGSDLALRPEDVQVVEKSFSDLELSAAAAPCRRPRRPRPVSVEHVIEELKSRYRKRKVPSLDGQVPLKPMSLDKLRVNICLLSMDKLDALCGCGGSAQRQPFGMSSLESKESSVVELEDLFNVDEYGEVPCMQVASGIAGSGKTMAFLKKAPFEWAKKRRRRPFWKNITMLFGGSLTNPDWWEAKNLAEVFGLSSFDLSKEEEVEVVRYIRSHAAEVLLVADSMDEAELRTDSFLWSVLTGNCEAVEGLKVIICSRPCEKTSWLAKTYLFDRHLEVVGFTEEKIGQFVQTFFSSDSTKASELQAQLVNRPDVRSLMHTPLLATMICRRFHSDSSSALPSTQTDVYQKATLAMVRQSIVHGSGTIPDSILGQLSPPRLHVSVVNLSRLAYDALATKHVVITKPEVEAESTLAYAARLGFLSLSPGADYAGQERDLYSFPHHTMLEFFAAVYAVRELIGTGKNTISDLVGKLGIDGDLSQFWVFVSGLLGGEHCETLLCALAGHVNDGNFVPEKSRRRLLLIDCYAECESKLQDHRSATIANLISTKELDLRYSHLSVNQAYAVSSVIQRYFAEMCGVDFHHVSMDASCWSQILGSLLVCPNLTSLGLPNYVFSSRSGAVSSVIDIIQKSAVSLLALTVPVGDDDLPTVTPVIQKCTRLQRLNTGSHSLTSTGVPAVADMLRNHLRLQRFGLTGALNDDEFASVARALCSMSTSLTELHLYGAQVSPAMIGSLLSSLSSLVHFGLFGVQIGDDGLCQVAQLLAVLQVVELYNVGLTSLSTPTLDALLHKMPANGICHVAVQRSLFLSAGQDIADNLKTTTMIITGRNMFRNPICAFGMQLKSCLKLKADKGQELSFYL